MTASRLVVMWVTASLCAAAPARLCVWDCYEGEIATWEPPVNAGAGDFEAVASAADVPEGGLLSVARADGERICLARRDGELYAFTDECTHQAFPLSAGSLVPGACKIECIWHGAQFDLVTGAVAKGPALEGITRYAVKVEGGKVLIGKRL